MTVETRMGERRNEMLAHMAAVLERILTEHEIPPAVACFAANAMVDAMVEHWGGQNFTFPKDYRWNLAKLELEAYDLWASGMTFDRLAQHFHFTDRGMRKLIGRVRQKLAAQRHAQQLDMLDAIAPEV